MAKSYLKGQASLSIFGSDADDKIESLEKVLHNLANENLNLKDRIERLELAKQDLDDMKKFLLIESDYDDESEFMKEYKDTLGVTVSLLMDGYKYSRRRRGQPVPESFTFTLETP